LKMNNRMNRKRVIISGGGTGGHIFPAVAIANTLRNKIRDIEILFVGAQGKMEMDRVPSAGYKIIGLPVVGLQRKISLSVFITIFKLLKSMRMARQIIRNFKPDVVVGVGGYASGPVLRIAVKKGIPTLIQEQNSFAGITNKLLAGKVNKICVAYEGMEKYFPEEKTSNFGNPVRKDLMDISRMKEKAAEYFNIKSKKVLFITGGSLGARSINEAVLTKTDLLAIPDLFVIWQTGKLYLEEMKKRMLEKDMDNIMLLDFIPRMDLAYAISDVIVCRAGALTCAELAITAKPAVLVPSPNVAEDHQTKNALAFVDKGAAIMVKDKDSFEEMIPTAINLLDDLQKQETLKNNIKKLAKPTADEDIANEVIKLME